MGEDHSGPVFPTTYQSDYKRAYGRHLGQYNADYMTMTYREQEEKFLEKSYLIKGPEGNPVRFDAYQAEIDRGWHMELPGTQVASEVVDQLHIGLKESLAYDRKRSAVRITITDEEIIEFENHLKSIGVSSVGYCEIPERMIFEGKGIIAKQAIVLAMPMDYSMLKTAPSADALTTVLATYSNAGDAANEAARWLTEHEFDAQASHSLMGMTILPPLAREAGMGWLGESGMLITPEHGPGVRLAAVFTSIENLPDAGENPHAWVGEYCKLCGNCARQCPSGAIMRDPIVNADGSVTTIDREKCFKFYLENYGCGVCLIACPFIRLGYEKVKRSYTKLMEKRGKK